MFVGQLYRVFVRFFFMLPRILFEISGGIAYFKGYLDDFLARYYSVIFGVSFFLTDIIVYFLCDFVWIFWSIIGCLVLLKYRFSNQNAIN